MAAKVWAPLEIVTATDLNIVAAQAFDALKPSGNLAGLADLAASRLALGLGGAAVLSIGMSAGTVAAGDDSRIVGALQASANLTDLTDVATARAALALDGPSLVWAVGTSAGTVAAGDDSRFGSITGAHSIGTASAAYMVLAGGATATNGGAGVISTAGTDTNTHLLLTTKNSNSVVESNRPLIFSTSSTLDTLVGLRSPYTLAWFHNNLTYAGAVGARFRVSGTIAGTTTGSNFAVNEFATSSDNVDASSAGGLSLLYSGMTVGGAALRGNRTAVTGKVFMSTASPNQDEFKFLTGGSFGSYVSVTQGGVGNGYGEMRGYIFGGLLQAKAMTGGYFPRQIVGLELNVGSASEALDVIGIQIVQETDADKAGIRSSAAYGLVNGTNFTGAGWDFAYSYLLNNGINALHATRGTILGAADNQYTTSPTAAYGADFVSFALSQAAFRGPSGNSIIDGSGNIGGQVVAGTTLQTRSSIVAKTAVVNTITVVDGSLILSIPTLTVAAPPGSGTQATAAVNTVGAALMKSLVGGTGYAVNDTVTLSGGTFTTAAVFTVAEVSAGVPTRLTLTTAGSYTVLPSAPVSTTTSGSGTGLTVNLWWTILTVTVTGAGSNYPQYPLPLVTAAKTTSGSDISPLRRPMFTVAMTDAAAEMDATNGGQPVKVTTLKVGSNQVVTARQTGWTAATGTATRGTFATGSVTLPDLAERVKALIDDMTTHGLIGT